MTCKRSGLSLVETVAVAGLISLVLLFTLGLIPSFKIGNRRANMELYAGTLAQSILEEQRARPFTDVISEVLAAQRLDNIDYTPELEVQEIPPGKMKSLRVTVRWSWKDRAYSTTRETRICEIPRS